METPLEIITAKLQDQRAFFATHQTKSIAFRKKALKKFYETIKSSEEAIAKALYTDLHKSSEEAYLTEISIVLAELKMHIKNLKSWAQEEHVSTPIHLLPSSSKIISEPLGVALIVAPWNYPFQLLLAPLIGAVSAGNCAILKPSPDAPATAKVMEEIVAKAFDPKHVTLVHGGKETNTHLFAQRFDLIFFTGSPMLGKVVMKAAAENLTPVVLELGGKSPAIVDENANLDKAAKRIVWGKLINAGQTCIAPDYLFVHENVKDVLLAKMKAYIAKMYGENIRNSSYYPRIVSPHAMERLTGLLKDANIIYGGKFDMDEKFIEPTFIDITSTDIPVMQQEIFGPILPVMTFKNVNEAIDYINAHEKPLAFYYFGKNRKAKEVLYKTTSGGACINDTLIHIANDNLPFGGVGNSGMASYHGKQSFIVFSHRRAVVSSPTWIDMPFKYVPFKFFSLIKKII